MKICKRLGKVGSDLCKQTGQELGHAVEQALVTMFSPKNMKVACPTVAALEAN